MSRLPAQTANNNSKHPQACLERLSTALPAANSWSFLKLIQAMSGQAAPRRTLAGKASGGEAGVGTGSGDAPAVEGKGRALREGSVVAALDFLFDPAGERGVVRGDEDVAGGGVGGRASPVGSAVAGELEI